MIYLIAGIIAIGAALYFMTLEASNIFDWFILGMGVVSIIKGVRDYWEQHGGFGGGGTKREARPADDKLDDA
jgi:hypothetical protein